MKAPDRLINTMTAVQLEGSAADLRYLRSMTELDNEEVAAFELIQVGAGIGSGFENTNKLKVMNYKEAMKSKDAKEWTEEVGNEKKRFDNSMLSPLYLEVKYQKEPR